MFPAERIDGRHGALVDRGVCVADILNIIIPSLCRSLYIY